MTGYQRDIIRENAWALLYVLKHMDFEKVTSPSTAEKVVDVLAAIAQEHRESKDAAKKELNDDRRKDLLRKGKLVKSTDPRKAAIVNQIKLVTGAVKVTCVKETRYFYTGIPMKRAGRRYTKLEKAFIDKDAI